MRQRDNHYVSFESISAVTSCRSGFHSVRSGCFYIQDKRDKVSWDDAFTRCANRSADLAIIASESVRKDITKKIGEVFPDAVNFWVGLR